MTDFVSLRNEKYPSNLAGSIHRELQDIQDDFHGKFHQENIASGSVLKYSTNVFVGIKDSSLKDEALKMSRWQLCLIIVCAGCIHSTCRIHAVGHTLAEGWVEESNWTDRTNSLRLAHHLRHFTQHAARSSHNVETALLCERYQLGAFVLSIPSGFSE